MASNSQLYDNIFERIRAPLAEAVDDALSSLHQSSGTPLLRLEACLDQDHSEATQGAQKEAKRTTLVSLMLHIIYLISAPEKLSTRGKFFIGR